MIAIRNLNLFVVFLIRPLIVRSFSSPGQEHYLVDDLPNHTVARHPGKKENHWYNSIRGMTHILESANFIEAAFVNIGFGPFFKI